MFFIPALKQALFGILLPKRHVFCEEYTLQLRPSCEGQNVPFRLHIKIPTHKIQR